MKAPIATLLLIFSAQFLSSCSYKYNTVTFVPANTTNKSNSPVPDIQIDTLITLGMFGGDVKSNKPYEIRVNYLDNTFTFASAEFTKVTVTYADGTVDSGCTELTLPQKFLAREYVYHNSMSGGTVITKKSSMIQAIFPKTVTRDEAFILHIEGKYTKNNGKNVPFNIKKKFNIIRDQGKTSWADFISSC